jgi:uncharacterized Tic20 family protein
MKKKVNWHPWTHLLAIPITFVISAAIVIGIGYLEIASYTPPEGQAGFPIPIFAGMAALLCAVVFLIVSIVAIVKTVKGYQYLRLIEAEQDRMQ